MNSRLPPEQASAALSPAAIQSTMKALSRERDLVRKVKQQWLDTVDAVRDPIMVHDRDFRIVRANRAYAERAGMPFSQMIGRPYWECFPKSGGPLPECSKAITQGRSSATDAPLGEEILLSTGEIFVSRAYSVSDSAGRPVHVLHLFEDVTESKRAQVKIGKLNRLYATLSGVNSAIVHSTSAAELFDRVCRVAVEAGHFKSAWIADFDAAQQKLTPRAKAGLSEPEFAQLNECCASFLEPHTPVASALADGRIHHLSGLSIDGAPTAWDAGASRIGAKSCAAMPLRRGSAVVGVMKLYVSDEDFFDEAGLALLREMSADLSFALDNFARDARRGEAEAALRESEERFRTLAEVSPDGVFRTDADGNGLFVNQRWCEYAGMSEPEARGQGWQRAIHPEDRARVADAWYRAAREQVPYQDELRFQDSQGRVRWVIVHTAPEKEAGGKLRGYVGTVSDITDRKRNEDALRQSEQRLAGIVNSQETFVARVNLQDSLTYVNETFSRAFGAKVGDSSWSTVHPGDASEAAEAFVRLRGPPYRCSVDVRNRIGGEWRWVHWQNEVIRDAQGEIVEIQGIGFDINERKRAEQAAEESATKLRDLLGQMIETVALAVEKRDPYTAGHQREVADLAVAIAREMGMPEPQIEGLRLGATIHDIGKIYVPAEILSRPGKLTPAEFEIVKAHPQMGYDIMKGVDFPWPVTQMILQHHERLDGSGYPQGLKAEAIIPEARILAVADVVEAISSHRPYRPALGMDAALKEIAKDAGTKYDRAVVDACMRVVQRGKLSCPPIS